MLPLNLPETDFIDRYWEETWTYIKTIIDIDREPILMLDKDLCVMAANDIFYQVFQVEKKDTENKAVYELGNGQWNNPDLRRLLEDIIPNKSHFKGFEVTHIFPGIGRRVVLLSARQVHLKDDTAAELFPSIILLAMEDVTDMMTIAETLAEHTNELEKKLADRTQKLEVDNQMTGKMEDRVKK